MFECRVVVVAAAAAVVVVVVVVVVVDRGMDVAAMTLLLKTMLAMEVPAHFWLPVVSMWVVLPFDIRPRWVVG